MNENDLRVSVVRDGKEVELPLSDLTAEELRAAVKQLADIATLEELALIWAYLSATPEELRAIKGVHLVSAQRSAIFRAWLLRRGAAQ